MPPNRKLRRPQILGSNCVFFIPNFKGFAASYANEYGTVVGTINEVETPYGTGISVGVANSYVHFNWRSLAPLTVNPRSVFTLFNVAATASGNYTLASWGTNAADDCVDVGVKLAADLTGGAIAGLQGDTDNGGSLTSAYWYSIGWSNAGVNGGANVVYINGLQAAAGTNGGAGVTAYSNLYLFRLAAGGPQQCGVGSIIQSVAAFDRVLNAGEHLDLHNRAVGNKLY